jgi:alanyl-tRNA synthetase
MRYLLPLVLLLPTIALAAEPPIAETYLRALEKLADTLADVTDEKNAAAAKPKVENFLDEAKSARERLFRRLAELDDEAAVAAVVKQMGERVAEANGKTARQFDRLAADHKLAYKLLRDTKLFVAMEKERDAAATRRAKDLIDSVRIYAALNGGKRPKQLADIAKTPEDAKKYLLDPWGYPFQYQAGEKHAHVWTISPYTGEKLGSPPPDAK